MKVALGMRLQEGPFGGGNQFGKTLSSYLQENGINVVFELKDKDIDIIVLTDPRTYMSSVSFGAAEIASYIKDVHNDAIVVHRINECDERKGTKLVNKQLSLANSIADHTVYIGSWLPGLFRNHGYRFSSGFSVIKNGADPRVFAFQKKALPEKGKVKIVTHHWSPNKMKGWDVYLKLDKMLKEEQYASRFEFHYIGQVPQDLQTNNIIFHDACSGKTLADELDKHHIYLTGSMNEPAGMHHIEGALCGLPLLYRNSGALPEYCNGYGIAFDGPEDLGDALDEIIENYDYYSNEMSQYNNTSEKMCSEYLQLFERLLAQKDKIIASRNKKNFNLLHIARLKVLFFCLRAINRLGIH